MGCTLGAFNETFQLCAEAIDTSVMKMLMCMGVTGDGGIERCGWVDFL